MARHEAASSKPDDTSVVNIENPTQAQDQDQYGGGRAGSSGGSAQIFEVTDLLIPSGTDWSSAIHVLGTFTLALGEIGVVTFSIEVADPLAVDSPTLTVSADATTQAVNENLSPNSANLQGVDPKGVISDTASVGAGIAYGVGSASGTVFLQTSGPTTADITVVRARAALLLI